MLGPSCFIIIFINRNFNKHVDPLPVFVLFCQGCTWTPNTLLYLVYSIKAFLKLVYGYPSHNNTFSQRQKF